MTSGMSSTADRRRAPRYPGPLRPFITPQSNSSFTFSKNPLAIGWASSPSSSANSLSRFFWRALSRVGVSTSTRTCSSPRRLPCTSLIPLPFRRKTAFDWGPRGDFHLDLPLQRGHLDLRSQGGVDEADGHLADDVRSVPGEDRVVLDDDDHVQVPGRAAPGAVLSLAPQLEPRARVDACRDLDVDGVEFPRQPHAVARGAGVRDHPALAAALIAGAGYGEEALLKGHLSGALAGGTGLRRGALFGAGALAIVTGSVARDLDLLLGAEGGLLERDLEVVAQVFARWARDLARPRGEPPKMSPKISPKMSSNP